MRTITCPALKNHLYRSLTIESLCGATNDIETSNFRSLGDEAESGSIQ